MSMSCRYPDQDLPRRLDQGIVRYKGKPFILKIDRGGDKEVGLYKLAGQRFVTKIKVDDPDLDISTPPLGYIQYNEHLVAYVMRRPLRQFKQTITQDTVVYEGLGGKALGFKPNLYSQAYEDAVLGKFPTYQEIRDEFLKLNEKCEKVLSLEVALQWVPELKIIHVFYKNEIVGLVTHLDPYTVIVPDSDKGWIVSRYLGVFRGWKVQ